MAEFLAPPGHPCQPAALVASSIAGKAFKIGPPDVDLEEPVLKAGADSIKGSISILQHIANGSALYPEAAKGDVDKWLGSASTIEHESKAWVDPFASAGDFSDEDRAKSQAALTSALTALEAHLAGGNAHVAGGALTIADVYLAAVLQPLFGSVLSAAARAPFPATLQWLQALGSQPEVAKSLGTISLCAAAEGWCAPAPKDDGRRKKKKGKGNNAAAGGEGGAAQQAGAGAAGADDEELDPEKAAKKAAKLAEKAAKAAKFAAKQAAQEAAAAAKNNNKQAGGEGGDKKAAAKAEAEAKKKAEAEEVARLLAEVAATPKGAKKDTSKAAAKAYNPKIVETGWYEWWEQCGFFKPDVTSDKPPFVIVIPPPNVTGALHIGHALTNSIQDTITRWRRMSGYNTLWVPGTDHAGIATQTVVEKMLAKDEGVSRLALGREAFEARVWEWKAQYGGFITEQLRRLGASCDWSRERFTLDAGLSDAVAEAFVALHDKGLIYRGSYMVNWSPALLTAVSDLEVEYSEEPGFLYFFKYPIADGPEGAHLPVATTRPETILGDTAVAVHPEDERYKQYIGKECVVPMTGRRIRVIADEYVDREFGTGALKITPGHDPNDYEIGKRFGLEIINIMNKDATLNDKAGKYAGMDRFKARAALWADMEAAGLVLKKEPYTVRAPRSQRSGEIVEPLVSEQWFVRTAPLAGPALKAVADKDIVILPERFERVYNNWLENIKDWCISRQLWWGHRIPVWYVFPDAAAASAAPDGRSGTWVVARNEAEAYDKARATHGQSVVLKQEEDVLDTWFSSGLWPFSTLGWPNAGAADLAKFYPTQVMETGHDILFFWVARMIMMGLELTGKAPFHTVYLHGLVRDEKGRKMSKSLGNVVDPRVVIEGGKDEKKDPPYGADVLRLWVASVDYSSDVMIGPGILKQVSEVYRKLRGTLRFLLGNLAGFDPTVHSVAYESLPSLDKFMLYRLAQLQGEIAAAYDSYSFAKIYTALQRFVVQDLSNFYLDVAKDRQYIRAADDPSRRACQTVMYAITRALLAALAPVTPHMAEDAWLAMGPALRGQAASVFQAGWAAPEAAWSSLAPDTVATWGAVLAVRNTVNVTLEKARNAKALGASLEAKLALHVGDDQLAASLARLNSEAAGELPLRYVFLVSQVEFVGTAAEAAACPFTATLPATPAASASADAAATAASSSSSGASTAAVTLKGDITVGVSRASGTKCARCWNFSEAVGTTGGAEYPDLCERCTPIVKGMGFKPISMPASPAAAAKQPVGAAQ
mmetsp:Transcript_17140/g.42968  ORF Transcript_17140/g.42968 Transcript_17140/m.42968 type:complete len:1276 (-) Transcript_17140:143-3970(-)